MNGSEFVAGLPDKATPQRDDRILAAVKDDQYVPIDWCPVPVSTVVAGETIKGTVFVSSDALRIGDRSNSIRVNVSHVTAEKIAMHLGVFLPTAKVEDATYAAAAIRIDPQLQKADAKMADTSRMVDHSNAVDAAIDGRCGLTRPIGKIWTSTNRLRGKPGRSANYGWHSPSARYQPVTNFAIDGKQIKVWQPGPGLAHVASFKDYSQVVCGLMKATMVADGREMLTEDVANDPRLCWLISTEGPMANLRHPAVATKKKKADDERADTEPSIDAIAPVPVFHRTLRLTNPYMTGDDVAALQSLIGTKADGVFGPNTKAKLSGWQSINGLDADGIFGSKSRKRAYALIADPTKPEAEPTIADDSIFGEFSLADVRFKQARNFTNYRRSSVLWIVIHSAEIVEKPSSAEALMSWVASDHAPRASWHYAIDNDSITQSVEEDFIAWHAPGANRFGVGYEHAGYARQSADEWRDEYSEQMLWLSAQLAAQRTCPRWDIPVQFVDAAGLLNGHKLAMAGRPVPNEFRGFTTHHEVTKSGIKEGSHVDPGEHFPMDWYLDRVRDAL